MHNNFWQQVKTELSSSLEGKKNVLLNTDDSVDQAQGRAECQDGRRMNHPMKTTQLSSRTLTLGCYVSGKYMFYWIKN